MYAQANSPHHKIQEHQYATKRKSFRKNHELALDQRRITNQNNNSNGSQRNNTPSTNPGTSDNGPKVAPEISPSK